MNIMYVHGHIVIEDGNNRAIARPRLGERATARVELDHGLLMFPVDFPHYEEIEEAIEVFVKRLEEALKSRTLDKWVSIPRVPLSVRAGLSLHGVPTLEREYDERDVKVPKELHEKALDLLPTLDPYAVFICEEYAAYFNYADPSVISMVTKDGKRFIKAVYDLDREDLPALKLPEVQDWVSFRGGNIDVWLNDWVHLAGTRFYVPEHKIPNIDVVWKIHY